VSTARKLVTAAAALLILIGALGPATASAHRSAHARISTHASQRHHAAKHHPACARRSKAGRRSRSRQARSCVRGAHTKHPPTLHRNTHDASVQTVAAKRAATIAAVLATPCTNTELTPEAADLEAVRAAVLCLVNQVRAQHGETPLEISPDLERAAQGHSQELVELDYFAHVSPSGETPVDRVRATGYIPGPSFGFVIGENLAWGTLSLSTPQAIVAAWVASPGHLANILEGQYENTGIGIVPAVPPSLGGGQQGATYSQEFGVVLN
jgi:uncharacterized protein YkwD